MTAIARNIQGIARLDVLVRPEAFLVAVVAAGAGLRLQLAWSSLSNLLLKATSDDAFYYFQIAHNVTSGHNVTFDGENLTNGFHPLWLVVVTLLSFFTNDRELLVHLGLTAGALLGAATAVLIYAILIELTKNAWAALVGAAFYALHPYIITESVNGLETSLGMFFFALTVLLFVRLAMRSETPSWRDYALLGASGGLMVLSRTDLILTLGPMLLYFLARERRATPLTMAAAAFVVVLPWVVWMLVTFGTLVQVSGVAVPDVQRQFWLSTHSDSIGSQLGESWDVTHQVFLERIPDLYFVSSTSLRAPFLALAGAAIAFMLLAPLTPQRGQARRAIGLLTLPSLGIFAALLFSAAIRWHYRDWYLAPIAVLGALMLGFSLHYVEGLLRRTSLSWSARSVDESPEASSAPLDFTTHRGLGVLALYGAVVAVVFAVYGPQTSDYWTIPLPHRLNMFETARWLAGNTDKDARVGSFNAGILGYFSERTVVNLDGVVNENAYHARRDGEMQQYVCTEELDYLVDLGIGQLWNGVGCPEQDPCLAFETIATIGRPLFYFGGAQLDVLQLTRTTDGQDCAPAGAVARADVTLQAGGER